MQHVQMNIIFHQCVHSFKGLVKHLFINILSVMVQVGPFAVQPVEDPQVLAEHVVRCTRIRQAQH